VSKPEERPPCSWCSGTGFVGVVPCRECDSTGREKESHNAERERAARRLGEELRRHEPAGTVDFRVLVPPNVDELPSRDEWQSKQDEAERARRLHDADVVRALTEQDVEWLVRDGAPPDPSAALRRVWRWEERRRKGEGDFTVLVLLGLKGRGKTLAGAWLLANYGPGVYCTAEQLRAAFVAPPYAAERDLVRRAHLARVLFVDELGRERDAETANASLFDVINCRRGRVSVEGATPRGLRYARWTLLAGNITEATFRERYDASTVAKIEQQGFILTAQGPDLRVRMIDRIKRAKGAKGGT
jgi:hypothetical protein